MDTSCPSTERAGVVHTHLTRFPGGEFCVNCGHASTPGGPGVPYEWWTTSDTFLGRGKVSLPTLAMVAAHLTEAGADARDLVYLLEKPWKYTDEFIAAVRACAPSEANPS